MGRPTKYNPTMCVVVEKLAKLGCTNEEMADVLDISPDTFYRWMNEHDAFSEARARGGVIADANVASRLYERAMGYEHDSVHVTSYQGEVKLTPIIERYPPDTQAAQWWLQNRQPKRWKRVTEPELGDVNEAASELQRIAQASRATNTS